MRNIDLGVAKGSALSRKPIMSKSIGFDGISLYLKCFWRNCILCMCYVGYYFEWIHVTIKRAANLFVRRFAFWIEWLYKMCKTKLMWSRPSNDISILLLIFYTAFTQENDLKSVTLSWVASLPLIQFFVVWIKRLIVKC